MVIDHIRLRNEITILALELLDTIGTEYIDRVQETKDRTNVVQSTVQNYLLPIQA